MNTDEPKTVEPKTIAAAMPLRSRGRAAFPVAAILAGIGLAVLAAGPVRAGHVSSPIGHYDTVPADDTDTYHLTFSAGHPAELEANDFGSGDIDLFVYDADGDLVDQDTMSDGDPMCFWTPSVTQTYTVHLVNRTGHAISYELTSN